MSILTKIVFVAIICNFVIDASPQLDLPPLPPPSSARPEILLNSYTDKKLNNNDKESDSTFSQFDRNRSERFG
jgi:hypothetical protein